MREVSRNKLDFELEIQGLSSPQIVRKMKEAEENEGKVIKVDSLIFMYRDSTWYMEEI